MKSTKKKKKKKKNKSGGAARERIAAGRRSPRVLPEVYGLFQWKLP